MQSPSITAAPAETAPPPVALPETVERPHGGWGAFILAWGVWAVVFLGTLVYVHTYGSAIPREDDWALVPYVAKDFQFSRAYLSEFLDFLWQLVNEHRQVLYKLVLVSIVKLSGGDFRAGGYFSAVTLGALSFAMIWAARRVRGWTAPTDGFFALVLFPLGAPFYLAYFIAYLLATLLAGVVLVVMVTRAQRLTLGGGVLAGLCVALLPLCSAPGLALGPGLGAWLLVAALLHYRSGLPHAKRDSLVIFGLLGVALAVAGAYFIGFQRPASYGASHDLSRIFQCTLEFFTGAFSSAALYTWPVSQSVMAVLLVLSLVGLANRLLFGSRAERLRALALLFFFGAVSCLALAIGVGRAAEGPMSGLQYTTNALPILCWMYFVWQLVKPQTIGRFAQQTLFALLCFAFGINYYTAREWGAKYHETMQAFEDDMVNGEPLYVLLARHRNALYPDYYDHSWLALSIQELQNHGIGSFVYLQPNPEFEDIPFPLAKATPKGIEWDGHTAKGPGPDSYLVLELPNPAYVAGLRIRLKHSDPHGGNISFLWVKTEDGRFPATPQYNRHRDLHEEGQEVEMTVYIADSVSYIYIQPDDKPFEVEISGITLFVPEGQVQDPLRPPPP